ncbi:MAG: hypothetical protein A2015_06985 [Spirochaetes bacterium GWF1_31_7]|nr:MAG: hypothetical protein A2Y30_09475 [Spirochaetes bacterium GWE1_32_154]OHD46574.1 MAG: hypothetical protein A2015_06985 [Spirochaetes bacterium GWF1_31_7]OHD49381.1 MAG: hypothetical protein A2Y29_03990 [Spirochaetes bacterium GWE2_31_10]HBD93125.1 hypothetical protein [Spirochaetia bacterium]HBI36758.1 hypothetical protein [Spirochaetia bacterium]
MKDNGDLLQYYKCQTDICYCSQLYGDLAEEHGSKVLMLFAEIYAYMVSEFGLTIAPSMIIKYENSELFKKWFWKVKHELGLELSIDPDFHEIGKWIGKGLFLKIVFSMLSFNRVVFEESNLNFNFIEIVKRTILRQEILLNDLLKENYFQSKNRLAIELFSNGYTLLNETIVLDYSNHIFISANLIS